MLGTRWGRAGGRGRDGAPRGSGGRWRRGGSATLLGLALLLGAARAEADEPPGPPAGLPRASTPFPVDKTTTVRSEGKAYYIDGPAVIPATAEITVQLGVQILGVNGASLEVRGGLKVHGTQGSWVTIKDVDFSPTREPRRGLHLDMADLHRCKFVHGEDGWISGNITIENSCIQPSSAFDVRLRQGFLKVMTTEIGGPARIRLDRPAQARTPLELELRSSWFRDVTVEGPGDVNVRHSEIKGELNLLRVTNAMVDGCDLRGGMAVRQGAGDSFRKVTLTKCNLFGGRLVLERPREPGVARERVKVDKFCFVSEGGIGHEAAAAIAERIEDHTTAEGGNVRATVANPQRRQHALVNYDLRSRAPPLSW